MSVDNPLLRRVIECILEGECRSPGRLGIVLIDRPSMQALNQTWRGAGYDTDVLSFPLGDDHTVDGEIFVNLDYAYDHCAEFRATYVQEVCRYVAHGVLHLMGYNDATAAERRQMRHLENHYLAAAGIIEAAEDAPPPAAPPSTAA